MTGIPAALAGLNIAGRLSGVSGALKAIPRQVWYALAAAALLVAGILYHHHRVHAHDKALIAAEDARLAKQALALKAKIDALTSKISANERTKNDAENNRIASDAADVLVRGPGKAVCRPVAPAAAREPSAPSGARTPAVAPVPDPPGIELLGVPFPDAVTAGEQADLNRAEALAWRAWYAKLEATWPK